MNERDCITLCVHACACATVSVCVGGAETNNIAESASFSCQHLAVNPGFITERESVRVCVWFVDD